MVDRLEIRINQMNDGQKFATVTVIFVLLFCLGFAFLTSRYENQCRKLYPGSDVYGSFLHPYCADAPVCSDKKFRGKL
jgi:hypothetical protein